LQKANITTGFLDFLIQPEEAAQYWRKIQKELAFDGFPEASINGLIFRGSFDSD